MAAPPPRSPPARCSLLVLAGGTQQQQPGMEKLNGPNPPWRRLLRSRSSTPTSPAPSRGLLARGGRSAGRGACARRRCAPAGGGCGCGPVAMRVVGTLCGARQTGASRSSRVSSRSHKQRTNNARTAHEQRTNSVRTPREQRLNNARTAREQRLNNARAACANSHEQRANYEREQRTAANSNSLAKDCAARPSPVWRAAAPGFQCLTHIVHFS